MRALMGSRSWPASPGTPPRVRPQDLFFAPVRAVEKLMERTGMEIDDYQLIEANEAFAVQALADGKELGWDWDRVNVNGGAVALGHPIGASGARVLTTFFTQWTTGTRRREWLHSAWAVATLSLFPWRRFDAHLRSDLDRDGAGSVPHGASCNRCGGVRRRDRVRCQGGTAHSRHSDPFHPAADVRAARGKRCSAVASAP